MCIKVYVEIEVHKYQTSLKFKFTNKEPPYCGKNFEV